jgi:hypothetical protein
MIIEIAIGEEFQVLRGLLEQTRFRQILLITLCLAFAAALSSYVLTGSHIRYSGDDYCYGAVLTRHGFFRAQWFSYFNLTAYHGNRYSLNLFSGIAGLFPPSVNGWLPGLAILIWVTGLTWIVSGLSKLIWHRQRTPASILIAEFIVFLSLYQAPDLAQSLYWRSGMLPYLAPLVFATLTIGLILFLVERDCFNVFWGISLGWLAFIGGGFSETGAIVQLCILMSLILAFTAARSNVTWAKRALAPLGVAAIATVLALIVLYVSPPNALRQMNLPKPPDLFTLASLSLGYALDFIRGTFEALPLPSVYTIFFCAILALNIPTVRDELILLRSRRALLGVLITVIVTYGLVVSVMIPFAYTQRVYPEPRALIASRYMMVLGLTVIGLILGFWGRRLLAHRRFRPLIAVGSVLCLGVCALYPLRAAKNVISELPRYQKWSQFWDARDREIRDAGESGVQDIEVIQIDHIIPRVGDLSPDPGYWYNLCAAEYYGADSIRASLPGWDD